MIQNVDMVGHSHPGRLQVPNRRDGRSLCQVVPLKTSLYAAGSEVNGPRLVVRREETACEPLMADGSFGAELRGYSNCRVET